MKFGSSTTKITLPLTFNTISQLNKVQGGAALLCACRWWGNAKRHLAMYTATVSSGVLRRPAALVTETHLPAPMEL